MTARTLEERLWSKVDKHGTIPAHRPELGPCWVWTGSTCGSRLRYGVLRDGKGGHVKAHRAAYALEVGRIVEGIDICHHCDNSLCVNPRHLFAGTAKENMLDCVAKGRKCRGTGHPNARLNPRQVRWIRACHAVGVAQVDIAQRLSISSNAVWRILHGVTWNHV